MFRFEYTQYLNYLWVVPILVLIYVLYVQYRSRQLASLGEASLLNRLVGGIAPYRAHIRMGLITVAVMSLILAYANPQWGNKKIVKALRGNRIGLIYFAGSAYLQMPLSNDYSAAQLFLSSANTNQASTQGTAISEAINLALRAYEEGKANQRALVIITDGESHDDDAIQAAKDALERGLKIYTIGVGTTEGAFVPYKTSSGEQYKRDAQGYPVKSALNTDLVKELAIAGGGDSYLIGEGNTIITGIKRAIDQLEKQDVEQRAFTDYASYFQYLLAAGLILLFIEFLLPESSQGKKVKAIA